MQRRVFLKSGALALVTLGLSPSFLRRSVFAQSLTGGGTRKGKVLVCLFQRGAADGKPFRAVAMTAQTPRILEGPAASVAMSSIDDFTIRASGGDAEARLEALYQTGSTDLIHGAGSEMFEAMKVLRAANPKQY